MPAVGKDAIFVVNGLPGDVYSVRLGGEGDVTKSRMLWHTPRKKGRDGPSPIVVGDFLLVSNMEGVATCYDPGTGKEFWKKPLSAGAGKITASPVAADGRAYFLFESGQTVVVEPGPEPKIVSESALGASGSEIFRASMAISKGEVFIRSDTMLYCIK